jgi:hypothetical protein
MLQSLSSASSHIHVPSPTHSLIFSAAAVHHAHMAYGADPGIFPSPVMFPFGAMPYGYHQMCYPNGEGGIEHYEEDDEDDMAQVGRILTPRLAVLHGCEG